MGDLVEKLKGGDLRSIGRVNEVVEEVINNPDIFTDLIRGMLHEDPVVRMRAADAVEKVTRRHPEYLLRFKTMILGQVAGLKQQEVRWHVAQIIPRLNLDQGEKRAAVEILFEYLEDQSRIVQTNALQSLVDLTQDDDALRPRAMNAVRKASRTGSPAVKNRAKKLLKKLGGS
jgi:HEAT repeat protein